MKFQPIRHTPYIFWPVEGFQLEPFETRAHKNRLIAKLKDVAFDPVFICEACGYTVEGSGLDRCPICGASKERFRKF